MDRQSRHQHQNARGRSMGIVPSRFMHMTAMLLLSYGRTLAFVAQHDYRPSRTTRCTSKNSYASSSSSSSPLYMSSVGDGPNDNDSGKNSDNPLNDWISRKDTENVRRAREQFAEGRLPISYGAMNTEDENKQKQSNGQKFGPMDNNSDKDNQQGDSFDDAINAASKPITSSALSRSKPNPYLNVVSRLTPSDLISRFTSSASPRVQDAVRTTVLGLIGGLPQMTFETKTIATGERLASLMFQLQMTGYMFKNAEYRLSLSQGLGGSGDSRMLPGQVGKGGGGDDTDKVLSEENRLKGKIKVRYGGGGSSESKASDNTDNDNIDSVKEEREASSVSSPGMEVEVDAQAYMSELRGEVSRLREELDATKQAKEEEMRKDLLMYIRTLPKQELRELTGTMSPEVLEAMKGLVTAVLAGIGDDEDGEVGLNSLVGGGGGDKDAVNKIGPETVTEQSGEALAQLCMWQLVVGFNLRELEVREGMKNSMKNLLGEGGVGDGGEEGGDGGGVQFGPGALE